MNKVAGIAGTTGAAVVLARKVPSARRVLRYAPLALMGAGGGAMVALSLDKAVMRPMIIFALVAVGIFVAVRPEFGRQRGGRAERDELGTKLRWLGLVLAAANVTGAQIGSRMVLARGGAGFVRAVLLIVVVLMAVKLAFEQFGV